MAHPMVEKVKEFGLRYGDKVAVGLTSLLFVVCLGAALSKKSIELTPDQVKKAAEAADTNINRHQERDDIIKVLEGGGIKPTNFAKDALDAAKTVLVADNYKPDREWVTPEPGAGLIRDTPVLIAPSELYAYPSRGGALVYDLDENGNRKPDTEKKDAPKDETRRRRRGRGRGGMGAMRGSGGGGLRTSRKGARKSQSDLEKEQAAEYEQKKRETAAKLVGADEPADAKTDQAKEKEQGPGTQPQYKEITKGLRWVAITGVINHAKLVANYREALKNPAVANPHYARLELERQSRQKDGSWSGWEKVDSEENLKILDNLPEEDEELTPDAVRPDNLNDPLPFLKAGLWEKVHIASLVPKEKKEVAKPPPAMGGMGGMGGEMGGGYGSMMQGSAAMGGMMRGGMSGSGGMMRGGMGGSGGMMGAGRMMGGMEGGSGMSGMMGGSRGMG